MPRLQYRPLTFLLTGFGWLVLSSVVGLAILIGLVRGTPLPPWVRHAHVHAALVGGVAQLILGGFLAFISPLLMSGQQQRESHPVLFLAINASAVGMLAGFWLHRYMLIGASGFLVIGVFLWLARDAWSQARRGLNLPPLKLSLYVIAFLSLFISLACGETMAFGFAQQSYGYVRLAHIHLNILGFITLVIVGAVHTLLPAVLNAPLHSPPLAKTVFIVLPLGVAVLLAGFLNSSVPLEIIAGGILFFGVTLYAINLFCTWQASEHKGSAVLDHLLIGTFFLLVTIVLGILVGVNSLSSPSLMPFGSLHLIAYTHMALVGFVLQTIMGVLSYLVPLTLAVSRVPNTKKRGPYLDLLTQLIDRWRAIQVAGLSLGTMGLGVLASLTWNVPLTSLPIRIATWACFGLLLSSLTLFSVKLAVVLGRQPEDSTSSPT